eukprot:ctg_2148.g334
MELRTGKLARQLAVIRCRVRPACIRDPLMHHRAERIGSTLPRHDVAGLVDRNLDLASHRNDINFMPADALSDAICKSISEAIGKPFRGRVRGGGLGGSWSSASLLRSDDGGEGEDFFVKLGAPEAVSMFSAEFEGLREMQQTQSVRVPAPVCYGIAERRSFIVMESLNLVAGGADSYRQLGEQLAAMHRHSSDGRGYLAHVFRGAPLAVPVPTGRSARPPVPRPRGGVATGERGAGRTLHPSPSHAVAGARRSVGRQRGGAIGLGRAGHLRPGHVLRRPRGGPRHERALRTPTGTVLQRLPCRLADPARLPGGATRDIQPVSYPEPWRPVR